MAKNYKSNLERSPTKSLASEAQSLPGASFPLPPYIFIVRLCKRMRMRGKSDLNFTPSQKQSQATWTLIGIPNAEGRHSPGMALLFTSSFTFLFFHSRSPFFVALGRETVERT